MLSLIWSAEALDDLDGISDYIGEMNPGAADGLIDKIEYVAERLVNFPYMHRTGRMPSTREAVVTPNYVLIYEVTGTEIRILSVLHTRRQYP